jgi:hypothetical protein
MKTPPLRPSALSFWQSTHDRRSPQDKKFEHSDAARHA